MVCFFHYLRLAVVYSYSSSIHCSYRPHGPWHFILPLIPERNCSDIGRIGNIYLKCSHVTWGARETRWTWTLGENAVVACGPFAHKPETEFSWLLVVNRARGSSSLAMFQQNVVISVLNEMQRLTKRQTGAHYITKQKGSTVLSEQETRNSSKRATYFLFSYLNAFLFLFVCLFVDNKAAQVQSTRYFRISCRQLLHTSRITWARPEGHMIINPIRLKPCLRSFAKGFCILVFCSIFRPLILPLPNSTAIAFFKCICQNETKVVQNNCKISWSSKQRTQHPNRRRTAIGRTIAVELLWKRKKEMVQILYTFE